MKKMYKKPIKLILIALVSLLLSLNIAYAWIGSTTPVVPINKVGGGIVEEYFHCGSGTETDPFVITRPIHYYHMEEFFQRLTELPIVYHDGTKDVVEFGKEYLYFQIGCPEEQLRDPSARPETNESTEYYVFDYDEFGEVVVSGNTEQMSQTLNMVFYTGSNALMPIGSSEIPFNGSLNGNGITITNVEIVTTDTVSVGGVETDRFTSDVGIFGYIGNGIDDKVSQVSNLYYSNLTIDVTGLSKTALDSVVTDVEHVKTSHTIDGVPVAYVGFIAGHIASTTKCNEVYINNVTIKGGASANNDYGFFGCVEDPETGAPITKVQDVVKELNGAGSEAGFGGSMDMLNIYNRINAIRTTAYNNFRNQNYYKWLSRKSKIVDEVNDTVTYEFHYETDLTDRWGYGSLEEGCYIYSNDTNGSGQYGYISGLTDTQLTTVNEYLLKEDPDHPGEYLYEEGFIIGQNANFIGLVSKATATIQTKDEANAQPFRFEGSYLYTRILDAKYYINRNGTTGIVLSQTPNTNWTLNSDNELYTTVNSTNYYLYDDNGTWSLTSLRYYYLVHDESGNYISINNNNVTNVTDPDSSTQWQLSNPTGASTTIYYTVNGTTRYLSHTNGTLNTSTTSFTWNKDANGYYATIQNTRFYLVYDNGWKLLRIDGYKINDGAGHYLSGNTTTVQNGSEDSSVIWDFSSTTGNTTISTIINGTRYYLRYNNRALQMSTTSTTWKRNGGGIYYTDGNVDYYLAYNNGWTLIDYEYFVIYKGTHYLRVTGANQFADGTEQTASHFYFGTSGANPSGTIFTYVGTQIYYLRNNNGTLNTQTTASTSWTNNGSSITNTSGNITYAIDYTTQWTITSVIDGKTITDGNGNYLTFDGSAIGNTTNVNNATRFIFSNDGTNSGYISTIVGGTTYYLRNNNGNFQTTTSTYYRTSWSYDYNSGTNKGNIYNGDRRLVYDNGWKLVIIEASGTKYRISYNGNYISANGTTLANTTDPNNALLFSSTSGNISTVINGTTYYLYSNTSNPPTISLSTSARSWTNDNGKLYFVSGQRHCYIVYSDANGWSRGGRTNNSHASATTLTFTPVDFVSPYQNSVSYVEKPALVIPEVLVKRLTSSIPQITEATYNRTISELSVDQIALSYPLIFKDSKLQIIELVNSETERTSCYFPIRTTWDDRLADDDPSNDNDLDYSVSRKNTGYIIGGRYDTSTRKSDIRISRYDTDDIDNSYSTTGSGNFTTIYTVDGTGASRTFCTASNIETIKKQDEAFNAASTQFLDTLRNGGGNVYGLHFMNSKISTSHIIIAPQATILGKTYQNYEFPEDSIDFHTLERGSITFFAGTYFSGNNAFFSLHTIERDSNNHITSIKEIKEVYTDPYDDTKDCVYKYTDETYSASVPSNYTLAFDTAWITNPSDVTQNNRIYYFSIPCNKGEFALGSVSGKTGAYLMYLDIASNGGESMEAIVGGPGDGLTDLFNVDFKDKDDNKEDYAILQFETIIPESSTNTNYSINVTFDDKMTDDGTFSKGTYTITITNNTGEDLKLYIFLCDDDDDATNAYPFAYRIVYTNGSNTDTVYLNEKNGSEFNQVSAPYIIPATGNVTQTVD